MDRTTFEILAAAVLAILVTRALYKLIKPWLNRQPGETLADRAAALEEVRRGRAAAYFGMFGSVPVTLAALAIFFAFGFALLYASIHAPSLALVGLAHMAVGLLVTARYARAARQDGYDSLDTGAKLTFRLVYACLWPVILFLGAGK